MGVVDVRFRRFADNSARSYKARAAQSNEEKLALASRAKSYLLLAKNAEWLQSTDEFLKAIENGKRWPHPTDGVHTFS